MEHTYQYAWIIPFVPLPVPIAIGVGLLLVPTTTKNLRRFWAFLSVLLLSIVMFFSIDLSIQQMNGSSIYQYLWSWTINNDFSLEFGDLIDPLTSIMLILITTVGIMVSGSHDQLQQMLVKKLTNLIENNGLNSLFLTLCASLLFLGAVAKSAQFPLHVWLPDAMEGPTPILALIHDATMVAAGIFLVARLYPLFTVIPYIMNLISLIGIIIVLLGATLALAQRDIKRSLTYSTMSQLGYIMLALGMGSYRAALFHLITHAYSKALLFLGSGSIIHCMESIVGYSPNQSQNMALMGGLTKYMPITKTTFLIGTLSLCGIPPLACFWSKDEILSDSWVYSPIFAIIAYFTAGLTVFYMFQMYLLTFAGHLNVYSQNFSAKKNSSFYSISIWGKERQNVINKKFFLSTAKKNKKVTFFSKKAYSIDRNVKKGTQPLITFTHFKNKENNPYPYESENTMIFPLLILGSVTLCVGFIGIPFDYRGMDLNILSNLLTPYINLLHSNSSNSVDWY
ncbi:hypothetical protein C5167_009427 [Papaver somniferum]|uniref:NAD(P)H-quinone oxidoreductase subunit 5, chloroplastic n=1 Tax=Papaver somniferum TaxID=3469 RepID=A0A4Y7JXD1_PAPSO|nr:hypothetical protein C5167_009427 [Papaver somniferum]